MFRTNLINDLTFYITYAIDNKKFVMNLCELFY